MSTGTLEELIDENHVIVSPSVGLEYDVSIFSLVYKDQLEPECAILMHNKIAGTFRERRYLVTSYGCILTTWMGFGVLRLTKGCIVAACLFGVALANYP